MTKEELHLPEGGNLNLDSINYSDLPLPNPSLYPADGAEEYLKMALGGNMNISTLSLNFWYEVMTEFATLHAQQMAEKMVEERLREELMTYDKFLSNTYWGISHITKRGEAVNEYLKTR